jgi:hypothetical protein
MITMSESTRPPVTDSPWFWVMMFSLMALGALLAIGGKYGRRQAAIERQYQARTRVAEQLTGDNRPAGDGRITDQAGRRAFATPSDPLIPLWPLSTVLVAVAVFAAVLLVRSRRPRPAAVARSRPRPGAPAVEHLPP